MLPAVLMMLLATLVVSIIAEDQGTDLIIKGAPVLAAEEAEALLGAYVGASNSYNDGRPQTAQLHWQLKDLTRSLLQWLSLWVGRVRYTVRGLWHIARADSVIKYTAWPLASIMIRAQVSMPQGRWGKGVHLLSCKCGLTATNQYLEGKWHTICHSFGDQKMCHIQRTKCLSPWLKINVAAASDTG